MKIHEMRNHALALGLAAALAPAVASAQSNPGIPTPDSPGTSKAAATDATKTNKAVNLETLVVTASAGATSTMGSSVSVSTLTDQQIQNSGLQNAADILRDVPGIRAESSGGDGNANIAVRGLPVASGGGKYAQFQIDGMPVLEFGDIAFATPDTFLRPDYNLESVQVVRGGSSSVFASNAPGAVINFITKTGKVKSGDVGVTYGLNYDEKRLDFDYGQPVSATTRFHVGGYLRDGTGQKDNIRYDAQQGGQLMGNLTHDIDGGFLRLDFQLLDDKSPVYLPVPLSITGSNGSPSVNSLPGFNIQNGVLQSRYFLHDLAVGAQGQKIFTDISDGYHSKVAAIGGKGEFSLGDDWKLDEQFRIANNSGDFVGPYPGSVQTAASAATAIGGAGATLAYATGPNAGKAVNAANVGGNGLVSNTLLFNVSLPNMNNATNNLSLKRSFEMGGSNLEVLFGYYHSNQTIEQDWHWNQYLETVQGKNAVLLNVYSAAGQAMTQNGLLAYGQPIFGNCCTRYENVRYTMNAPYVSLSWQTGLWQFDGGLRYDYMQANGNYASSVGVPLDVDGDGIIEAPEKNVQVVNLANASPVNYNKKHLEYSFGANYLLSNDVALFGRVSRGARFNADRLLFGGGVLSDGSVPDEEAINVVKQYEVGVKVNTAHTSLFVTGFYATTQETNQDVTQQSQPIINRDYRAKGVEVEGSLNYGQFALRGGFTYTDSTITKDQITPGDVGNTPQRQAHWIYQLSPTYTFGGFPVTVGATIIGTTKSYASQPNGLVMPGYTQVNAFARYAINPRMSVSLEADNLFNTVGLTEIDQSSGSVTPNGLNTARSILGRTIYANWRYSF